MQLVALLGGVREHALVAHGVDRGDAGGTGDGVAAVRAAHRAGQALVPQLLAGGDGGQRIARGDALGDGHDVRLDAVVLVAEPLAGAAHAGLDLVDDEAGADLVGDGAQVAHELGGRHDEAALALDGLDDDGGDVVAVDLGAQHAADVVERVGGRVLAGRRAERIAVARVVDAADSGS